MRVYDNGYYRDATPEEIEAWEAAASQPAPPPGPQEQVMTLARTMAAAATGLTDAVALSIPDLLPAWAELLAAGKEVAAGVCLTHKGQTYRVVQAVTPIEREHTGTLSDPIPWVYGMDCYSGKYYAHNGQTYLAKMDMLPCVWEPGSAGTEGQWEAVT